MDFIYKRATFINGRIAKKDISFDELLQELTQYFDILK
jgi:hypothetical protein